MNHLPKLELKAPIERWDEAVPLGNGLHGALLWGDGKTIKLSLDRNDLWDERTTAEHHGLWSYRGLEKAYLAKNRTLFEQLDQACENNIATKLPVGRLEFTLLDEVRLTRFELDLETATAHIYDDKNEPVFSVFASADHSGIYIDTVLNLSFDIIPPDYQGKFGLQGRECAAALGYRQGTLAKDSDSALYTQECDAGLTYGILVKKKSRGKYFVSVLKNGEEPLERDGKETHLAYWREFWNRSSISLPDPEAQLHYHMCRYFYGSASRAGFPPMPLQGVWTADDNTLPPWRGDYHHDLNTQLCYLGYLNSGDFEAGDCFLDFMFRLLPEFERNAKLFYDANGAAVPGVMSLNGKSLGGWSQYSFSITTGAWIGVMFSEHAKYVNDNGRAKQFLTRVGEFICHMLHKDSNGGYTLTLSSSPEIHDNRLEAYLTPLSNYDCALLIKFFTEWRLLCPENPHIAEVLENLPPLSIDDRNGLKLSPDEELCESHRHHSHLLGIYPLKIVDGKKTLADSLRRIEELGTAQWVGYSFSWMAAMRAYCNDGDTALEYLKKFFDAFCSRNTFHLNGDYKCRGYSDYTYRPFTLEGNFAAMQAIHEMLVSFDGETLNIFPALPDVWNDVSFQNLRIHGNIRVSAVMTGKEVTFLSLCSPEACSIKIKTAGSIRIEQLEPMIEKVILLDAFFAFP